VTDAASNRDALASMQTKLKAMGGVSGTSIGEPKSGVQSGFVAVIPQSGRVDETTLTSPREVHVVMLRRYENMMQSPQEQIEFRFDKWRAQIIADIFGDFELGGEIAFPLPTETEWTYGYQQVERDMYRLLDLNISYRIDDRATFAP